MENGAASYTYMEYGLSPPGWIESRRNREMVKKQVRTMATSEKIASTISSGGDGYISLWTADAKVWVQKKRRRACCVRRRMRSVEAAGTESYQKRNRPHSERRVPWTKGGCHSRAQCVNPGAATRSQCAWEGG